MIHRGVATSEPRFKVGRWPKPLDEVHTKGSEAPTEPSFLETWVHVEHVQVARHRSPLVTESLNIKHRSLTEGYPKYLLLHVPKPTRSLMGS